MRERQNSKIHWGTMAAALGCAVMVAGCATVPPPAVVRIAPSSDRQAVLDQIAEKERQDEFDHMIIHTDVDGDELVAFMRAVDQRAANMAAHQADPAQGTAARQALAQAIAAAEEAGDEGRAAALKEQHDALNAAHWEFRTQQRAEVMGVLSPANQTLWVGHHLTGRVNRALRRARPDEEQREQIRAISHAVAADLVADGIVARDPYLRTLSGEPRQTAVARARRILTREQAAALDGN